MRIGKFIANAGFCSRREAEKLIKENQININGKLCLHPSIKINETDVIKIKGKVLINNQKIRLWKIYKPIKYICTNKDPQKRKTIFDLIPKNLPRLISIGRLDYMSEGLLLLTNKGDFARKLELPASEYERIYRVCVKGKINKNHIKRINNGISINKIKYIKIYITEEKYSKPYSWLIIKLKEGKNREIRKICDHYNWPVVKLIRIQFGPYKLLNLKKGQIHEIMNIIN